MPKGWSNVKKNQLCVNPWGIHNWHFKVHVNWESWRGRFTQLSFSETEAELANLPNSFKIKKPLNMSNFKIKISFWNVLSLYREHFEQTQIEVFCLKNEHFSKICQIRLGKLNYQGARELWIMNRGVGWGRLFTLEIFRLRRKVNCESFATSLEIELLSNVK